MPNYIFANGTFHEVDDELMHYKYISREKVKGKWVYTYPTDPKKNTSGKKFPMDVTSAAKYAVATAKALKTASAVGNTAATLLTGNKHVPPASKSKNSSAPKYSKEYLEELAFNSQTNKSNGSKTSNSSKSTQSSGDTDSKKSSDNKKPATVGGMLKRAAVTAKAAVAMIEAGNAAAKLVSGGRYDGKIKLSKNETDSTPKYSKEYLEELAANSPPGEIVIPNHTSTSETSKTPNNDKGSNNPKYSKEYQEELEYNSQKNVYPEGSVVYSNKPVSDLTNDETYDMGYEWVTERVGDREFTVVKRPKK